MVQAALRHAQGDMLATFAANKLLDGQASSTDGDLPRLVSAQHIVSEESRQLVSRALDHAQAAYPEHQCSFEFHSPRLPAPPSRAATGRLFLFYMPIIAMSAFSYCLIVVTVIVILLNDQWLTKLEKKINL